MGGTLRALGDCSLSRLGSNPVIHVHIPKNAGRSLCKWAYQHAGLVPPFETPHHYRYTDKKLEGQRLHGDGCFLHGDGPPALDEPSLSASCADRISEASKLKISWMSVE